MAHRRVTHLSRGATRATVGIAAACLLATATAACSGGKQGRRTAPASTEATTRSSAAVNHPRGGVARVGVWEEPDPSAPTLGGAAVRALVLPQLFVAQPDGSWSASLAAPGSDRLAGDGRSAAFRLRPGAVWSDGTPITVADLRRSADPVVAGVDGPAPDGTITVRFTRPLAGWHRLWSGTASVSAPRAGVWGGPFVMTSYTPGLEVVLRRNDRWYGGPGPFLDEVHLVLVPDSVTARQLLARGDLDAVMPLPETVRTDKLRRIAGVSVAVAPSSGWWVGLRLNESKLSAGERRALVATVDRGAFVGTLLQGEASVLQGFAGAGPGAGAGGADTTWSSMVAGPSAAVAPLGDAGTVDFVGENEEPMTGLLQKAMQRRARADAPQATLELRDAEADRVERWIAAGTYDAAITVEVDGPDVCWSCRWASVDKSLAQAADAGDAAAARALEAKLRDSALLLPLWRATSVVAWRAGLHGVRANGYGLSGAWDASEWWR